MESSVVYDKHVSVRRKPSISHKELNKLKQAMDVKDSDIEEEFGFNSSHDVPYDQFLSLNFNKLRPLESVISKTLPSTAFIHCDVINQTGFFKIFDRFLLDCLPNGVVSLKLKFKENDHSACILSENTCEALIK